MVDLQALVDAKRWNEISIDALSEDDVTFLTLHLSNRLPSIRRGDGIETYESPIRPHEAVTAEEEQAAALLERLVRWADRYGIKGTDQLFLAAIELAKDVLWQECGIAFETWHTTFIYPAPDGEWVTLRSEIGNALIEKRWRLFHEPVTSGRADIERLFHAERKWRAVYPWRNVDRVEQWWRRDAFGEFTSSDHALHILNLARLLGNPCTLRSLADDSSRFEDELGIMLDFAYRIGVHHDALQKKPAEHLAVQKLNETIRNRRNGRLGGQSSKKLERQETLNRLAIARAQDFAFASDSHAIRIARGIAANHDRSAAEPMFLQGGKPLSRAWYQAWVSEFRSILKKQR